MSLAIPSCSRSCALLAAVMAIAVILTMLPGCLVVKLPPLGTFDNRSIGIILESAPVDWAMLTPTPTA